MPEGRVKVRIRTFISISRALRGVGWIQMGNPGSKVREAADRRALLNALARGEVELTVDRHGDVVVVRRARV